MHVHAIGHGGQAKFWIEPKVELARDHGLTEWNIRKLQDIIEERQDEIEEAWQRHFKS